MRFPWDFLSALCRSMVNVYISPLLWRFSCKRVVAKCVLQGKCRVCRVHDPVMFVFKLFFLLSVLIKASTCLHFSYRTSWTVFISIVKKGMHICHMRCHAPCATTCLLI